MELRKRKIILDTDIGYDPDDLFALLFLYKLAKDDIALIVTANEMQGKRIKFLQQVVKTLPDFNPILARGRDIGLEKFTVDDLLVNDNVDENKVDYISAMKNLIESGDEVIYIGIGGFTNLAGFIDSYPDLAKKMKVYIMGGAVNYERHEGWVEYNIKIDKPSVKKVLGYGLFMTCVMAQTTHNPIYEVYQDHVFYKKLLESNDPAYKLLADHLKLWFTRRGHGTSMHDPLTVATALGYEYASFDEAQIVLSDEGKMLSDSKGTKIAFSKPESRAVEFMEFIEKVLFG